MQNQLYASSKILITGSVVTGLMTRLLRLHMRMVIMVPVLFLCIAAGAQVVVVDDDFDDGVFPFEGWKEINSSGQVTVVNGELQFDYTDQRPGAVREFEPAEGIISIEFNARSTRNWIHFFVYIRNHESDTVSALTLGSAGNRGILAITAMDDNGRMAEGVNALPEQFGVNRNYHIAFSINTFTQEATLYVDGRQTEEARSVPLLRHAENVASVVFLNDYMFSNEGRVYIDDLRVVYYQRDKTLLRLRIEEAQALLDDAEPGDAPGQYPVASINMLGDALGMALEIYDDTDSTQEEVDNAAEHLGQAMADFIHSENAAVAVLNINTDEGHHINEGFSGFNVRISDGPWNYNHPDFREAVQTLNPGFLRYFSGTTGNYLNMNTGMMEYAWFEQLLNHGSSYDDYPALYKWVEVKGPHRLIDLYDMLGENSAKLVITFNSFMNTPENAARLARFCKNNNIIVDYWQFINEPNFYTPPRRYLFNDGKDYAVKQKEVADSILSVDPDARLALSYGWDGLGSFARSISDYEPVYWNAVSFHAYPLRAADTDFDYAMRRANSRVMDRTNAAFYNKVQSVSWPDAPFIVTEYGVWNDMLSNTLYGAIFLSEYVMRMSANPRAKLIGNHVVNHAARPNNTHHDLFMDAFDAGQTIDPDTVPTGFNLRIDGKTFTVVNKALNRADFVYQSTIDGGSRVQLLGGSYISALYARAYRGLNGKEYVLITNKSDLFNEMDILLDGSSPDLEMTMTYAWSSDPAVSNVLVQSKTTAAPVRIPPYSVVRLEWDSETMPAPPAPRIYAVEHGEGSALIKWWERETAEKYTLLRGVTSGVYNHHVTIGQDVSEYETGELANGQTYYFAVQASNASGTSVLSNEVAYHVDVPDTPLFDIARPNSRRVTLEWESVPYANGYKVRYGTQPGVYDKIIDANNTTGYVLRNLQNGVTYYFSVSAYNGMGESALSDELQATPQTHIPQAPWYLHGHEDPVTGVVHLNWIPSDSTHQASFNVYRSKNAWSGYELVDSGINQTSYADSTFLSAGKYFYRIGAQNERGKGFFRSNIFTMDKKADTEDFFTNTPDMMYKGLLFPGFINPVKGERFGPIDPAVSIRYRIRLTDVTGRHIFTGDWGEHWDGHANGTMVPRGAYMWQVQGYADSDPFYKTGKVLVIY